MSGHGSDGYTEKETMECPKHHGIYDVSNTQCAHSSHITSHHITSRHTQTQNTHTELPRQLRHSNNFK